MTKEDYVIICGDFGGIWDKDKESAREKWWLDWLEEKPYTTLFVDGNHENFDRLYDYPLEEWNGGKVHKIRSSVIHLMRGQVFNIEDTKIFTFGGGESLDKDMRLENNLWWREEMPTPAEMTGAAKQLDSLGCKVDYIITHEPPSLVKSAMLLRRGLADRVNKLNGFFEEINGNCSFKHWYFGSLHEDRLVTPKHTCVFSKVLPINSHINDK